MKNDAVSKKPKSSGTIARAPIFLVSLLSITSIALFQNCGAQFKTALLEPTLNGLTSSDLPSTMPPASTPPLATVPPAALPVPPTPPVGNGPAEITGSMDPYLPQLSAAQCQPKTSYVDPFVNIKMNQKTVCAQGCDYTTPKEAFEKAQAYDEIVIEPGLYDGCLTVRASPVIVRGNKGMVHFDKSNCMVDQPVLSIESKNIKLINVKITRPINKTRGIHLGQDILFAELSDLWIEGIRGGAIGGGKQGVGTIVIKRFKIKSVGDVWGSNNHTIHTIATGPEKLIISRGTFSHFWLDAANIGSYGAQNVEIICNVSLRTPEEGGLLFQGTSIPKMRITNNFIVQAKSSAYIYLYLSPPQTELSLEQNYFINDTSNPNFIGNMEGFIKVNATGNKFVGSGNNGFSEYKVDLNLNSLIPSRNAAGIAPNPAVPKEWPIDLGKL